MTAKRFRRCRRIIWKQVTCDPVTQDASWQDETLHYKAELVVVAEVIAEVIRKRKYQEEIMEQEQSGKKNICKVICIVTITIALLYLLFWMQMRSFIEPTIIHKDSFSESEKNIIASELDIPVEKISIQEMEYVSNRETSIYFTVSTSSLDILASYKYQGDYYDDKPTYYKKGKDPHNDIICVVKSEQPYELYFILRDTWNTNLSNIVR